MEKSYLYIQSAADFHRYMDTLRDEKVRVIALDIEGEYNLHMYGEKLCLIQIFDGVRQVLIDPFSIKDEVMDDLFSDTRIIKIMYDASSDASLLKNHHGIDIKSIFDLRIAVEILDFEKQNLHFVLNTLLDTNLVSKGKYQRYNWTRRPIEEGALEYALSDVIYLFDAMDRILDLLKDKDLYKEFLLRSIVQQNKDYRKNLNDRHKKFKGYKRFSSEEKLIFKELFYIRDKFAKEINLPPNSVIENKEIYNIMKNPEHIYSVRFNKRIKSQVIHAIQEEVSGLSSRNV